MSDMRVNVEKVLFDPGIGAAVVLLKESEGERILPIWIGQSEALAIAMSVEKVSVARPMTHDLLKSVIGDMGASVDWVRVHDLQDGTFFASIRLNTGQGGKVDVDARPSDAIALALRAKAEIFVCERVFVEALHTAPGAPTNLEALDEDLLKNLPDEVFGKYKM